MSTFVSPKSSEELPKDIWMVRPCEIYREEYNDCSGFKGRFQQHYVFGQSQDCGKWKEDYENCIKFRNNNKSLDALNCIIKNERERREIRLRNAKRNDIWEYRTKPPEEWTSTLPGWDEQHENSLLSQAEKVRERQGQAATSSSEKNSSCAIL
ncbi:hypothetical protein ScPMuIL_007102 [Solemya velum]